MPKRDPERTHLTTTDLKKEVYCYYILTGLSPEEAYEEVGFTPDSGNAARYHMTQTVQERLRALRAAIEKRILQQDEEVWGDEALAKFLQANAIESRAQGDYAPSNRAIELLGRNRGMFGVGDGQQQGLQEVDDRADQAELAALWLVEMKEKHGVASIDDLIGLLRGEILTITGVIDTIEPVPSEGQQRCGSCSGEGCTSCEEGQQPALGLPVAGGEEGGGEPPE